MGREVTPSLVSVTFRSDVPRARSPGRCPIGAGDSTVIEVPDPLVALWDVDGVPTAARRTACLTWWPGADVTSVGARIYPC